MNDYLKRSIIAALLLTIMSIPFTLQAQKKEKAGILWRITGKGNSSPSYLFGTMHLRDKKVFNFPDSLYVALEQTDGFAMEVHPDSLMQAVLDREVESPLLSKALKPAAYEKIKKKLAKEFKDQPEKVTVEQLESYCKARYYRIETENSMNTFMDTYLYGAAERMGKWTGGVEDVSDQIGLISDASPESVANEFMEKDEAVRARIDSMINVYLKGNTDLMAWLASGDSNMVIRNRKMAVRMDSLMKVRTMTFAVGAAHLTGEDGVVDLLRSKGYTVEPVNFSKRKFVLDHPFKFRELPWVDVKDIKGLYTVQMPGEPMKDFEIPGTDAPIKVYVDLKSGITYFVFAMRGRKDFSFDSAKVQFLQKIDPELKVDSIREIRKGDIAGRDMMARSRRNVIRLQVFHSDGIVYAAYINHAPTALVAAKDIEKFFGSFDLKKPSAEFLDERKPREFESKIAGVKIWFPSKPTIQKEKNEDGTLLQYISLDMQNDIGYMVMVKVLRPGLVFNDDSVQLATYTENIQKNDQFKLIAQRPDRLEGFPGNRLDFTSTEDNLNLTYKTLNVIRGRRNYFFMAYSPDANNLNKLAPDFFRSISFFIPPPESWKEQAVPGEPFTLFAPEALEKVIDTTEMDAKDSKWLTSDSLSGISMTILKKQHSPYMQISSDTSFLREALAIYTGDDHEVLDFGFTTNGGLPSAELLSRNLKGHTIQRVRCILNGESLVYLFANGEKKVLESPEVLKMMNSFNPGGSRELGKLYESKTDTLLNAVTSPDSVISTYEATLAFGVTKFTEKDLPKLYSAMKVKYREHLKNTPNTIADIILKIRDSSSIDAMKKIYQELTPGNDEVRSDILNMLAGWKTAKSHKIAAELMLTNRPGIDNHFRFLFRFCDSIELATPYFHQLMSLAKDSAMVSFAMNFANRLLVAKKVGPSELQPYKPMLMDLAKKVATSNLKDAAYFMYYYDDLSAILGAMRDPASVAALRKMLTNPDLAVKWEVIKALVGLNQALPAADLLKIAADRSLRTSLYDTLAGAKKQALFPKQYLTQKSFGESILYEYALFEEGDAIKSIVFIGERTVTYKRKKQKVLLYKVTFDYEEPETYLGIAGPYPLPPSTKLRTEGDLVGMIYDHQYDAGKLDADLKAFIKQAESETNTNQ